MPSDLIFLKLNCFFRHFLFSTTRALLVIRWHDFVRNTEVIGATNLPSMNIQDIITTRRNSLFGHVVRLKSPHIRYERRITD